MTKREQYLGLAERAKKASGPDRELDELLWALLPAGLRPFCPAFTSCLTTLTAVIGEVLPGSSRNVGFVSHNHEDRSEDPELDQPEGGHSVVWPASCDDDGFRAQGCATEALALFAALCRALGEKEI